MIRVVSISVNSWEMLIKLKFKYWREIRFELGEWWAILYQMQNIIPLRIRSISIGHGDHPMHIWLIGS